jgi:hypothetical protein
MTHDPTRDCEHGRLKGKCDVCDLQAEVDMLKGALKEWSDKTDWVQETAQPLELGMHRADVLKQRIERLKASIALDKKAENARELGLSYDDEPKIGCVNHDCDKCKAVQESVAHQNWCASLTQLLLSHPPQPAPCNCKQPAQPAPVQEPDAIGCQCSECGEWQRWTPSGMTCNNGHGGATGINKRLFTTPPAPQPVPVKTYHGGKPWPVAPKPWVGLSEEEVYEAAHYCVKSGQSVNETIRAIEAKLREKNGGAA